MIRIDNVRIKDLLDLLNQLSENYEVVDIIVDPENKKVVLDPVTIDNLSYDRTTDLTDDNIEDLI